MTDIRTYFNGSTPPKTPPKSPPKQTVLELPDFLFISAASGVKRSRSTVAENIEDSSTPDGFEPGLHRVLSPLEVRAVPTDPKPPPAHPAPSKRKKKNKNNDDCIFFSEDLDEQARMHAAYKLEKQKNSEPLENTTITKKKKAPKSTDIEHEKKSERSKMIPIPPHPSNIHPKTHTQVASTVQTVTTTTTKKEKVVQITQLHSNITPNAPSNTQTKLSNTSPNPSIPPTNTPNIPLTKHPDPPKKSDPPKHPDPPKSNPQKSIPSLPPNCSNSSNPTNISIIPHNSSNNSANPSHSSANTSHTSNSSHASRPSKSSDPANAPHLSNSSNSSHPPPKSANAPKHVAPTPRPTLSKVDDKELEAKVQAKMEAVQNLQNKCSDLRKQLAEATTELTQALEELDNLNSLYENSVT